MSKQPYIPQSIEQVLEAANAYFDQKQVNCPEDELYKESYRAIFLLSWLKVSYRKLYEFTAVMLEEIND